MTDWMPIESAPRDGTELLVYGREEWSSKEFHYYAVAAYQKSLKDWQMSDPPGHEAELVFKPTHWQLLPSPPI